MADIEFVGSAGVFMDTEEGSEPVTASGVRQEQAGGAPPAGFEAAWAKNATVTLQTGQPG